MKKSPFHYAWIILGLCFISLLMAQGVRLSFGAFIQPWERDFGVSRSSITLISFVSFIIYGLTQPLLGRLTDLWGAKRILIGGIVLVSMSMLMTYISQSTWQLLILYGVVATLGFSATSPVVASVAITHWFTQNPVFAFSVIAAGSASGQLLLVPSSLLLINSLGWRTTSLVLGLTLGLVVVPILSFFLYSRPSSQGLTALGDTTNNAKPTINASSPLKASVENLWTTHDFWFLIAPFFICGITTTGLMDTHLIPFAHDHGFSPVTTSVAVSVLAAFNITGTLLAGVVADRWNNAHMLGWLYLGRALTIVLLVFTRNPLMLIVFAALFGLVDFATLAPTQLLATKRFQYGNTGMILGYLFMVHQLGSALGAFVPGLLYDLTGSYLSSLSGATTLLAIASVLSFALTNTKPPSRQTSASFEVA
ncbi:MAG: MFS transporter [Deinococcota bacterium]